MEANSLDWNAGQAAPPPAASVSRGASGRRGGAAANNNRPINRPEWNSDFTSAGGLGGGYGEYEEAAPPAAPPAASNGAGARARGASAAKAKPPWLRDEEEAHDEPQQRQGNEREQHTPPGAKRHQGKMARPIRAVTVTM